LEFQSLVVTTLYLVNRIHNLNLILLQIRESLLYTTSVNKKKIAVGLSGGVDSTLTALLLQQQGFDVIGVTLKLHEKSTVGTDGKSCGGNESTIRAQVSANELGIPLHVVNCCEQFEERILKKCWQAFETGTTPNPCYVCNAAVKFVELLKTAQSLGAEQIATGHYARIDFDSLKRPVLKRGLDANKDQSYFLSGISPEILSRTLFPLGAMQKPDVKKLAAQYGLSCSTLKESQDLCFAGPDGHFSNMLCNRYSGKSIPGIFVDENGSRLGTHNGIHQYTIGQRRGLGFATGERVKIISIDPQTGVIVVSGRTEAACFSTCRADPFTWSRTPLKQGEALMAQVRYRQTAVKAAIEQINNSSLQVKFEKPVFGVSPGQLLVVYQDDCVVGNGTIVRESIDHQL